MGLDMPAVLERRVGDLSEFIEQLFEFPAEAHTKHTQDVLA